MSKVKNTSTEDLRAQAMAELKAELKAEALKDIENENGVVLEDMTEVVVSDVPKKETKPVAKNPVQPKVTSKVDKVDSKISPLKTTMSHAERVTDTKVKLHAWEVMVKAYPYNHCFSGTRDRLLNKLEKLSVKPTKKS